MPSFNPFHQKISEICCNSGMALLLTSNGEVWLYGEDLTESNLFCLEGIYKSSVPIKIQISNTFVASASMSSHHAGIVCSEGSLYTWGKGENGELGYESNKESVPTRVENANIFKSKQVICGTNYTGICTQGGFLYIFGFGEQCECGGINGYPYTIPALEEYYVVKAYSSIFGIVVLTDTEKCYISNGCLCLTNLRANKKIEYIATCEQGICGLTKDKKVLYT